MKFLRYVGSKMIRNVRNGNDGKHHVRQNLKDEFVNTMCDNIFINQMW